MNVDSSSDEFNPNDPEPLLSTVVQLFANEGLAREVAILVDAKAKIVQIGYDNYGDEGFYSYCLHLQIPPELYSQISEHRQVSESKILELINPLMAPYEHDDINQVSITPLLITDKQWRDKAKSWLTGNNVSNQGRVRSNNVAPRSCDGLLFRSQPEILLYKALKTLGVSFAPLPVFIRGGEDYRRIEPDFVILKNGIVMVVEVDGDTVHHETPADAHTRTTMLVHEGAHVERVSASECDTSERAIQCAKKLVSIIEKLKTSR